MEPEGSLPQSQVPANCPYPEPARSSPYTHIPLPEDPSTPGSPKWSLSLSSPHQNLVFASSLPHRRYMLRPSHSQFYHLNNVAWGVQIIKLLITHPKFCDRYRKVSDLPRFATPCAPSVTAVGLTKSHSTNWLWSVTENPACTCGVMWPPRQREVTRSASNNVSALPRPKRL